MFMVSCAEKVQRRLMDASIDLLDCVGRRFELANGIRRDADADSVKAYTVDTDTHSVIRQANNILRHAPAFESPRPRPSVFVSLSPYL